MHGLGVYDLSYDISIVDPASGATLRSAHPHSITGGTYAVGGTTELWINVTYNYSPHFHRVLGPGGIRLLDGQPVAQTLNILAQAATQLDQDVHQDYWQATEGNARAALLNLLALAALAPEGVWRVS